MMSLTDLNTVLQLIKQVKQCCEAVEENGKECHLLALKCKGIEANLIELKIIDENLRCLPPESLEVLKTRLEESILVINAYNDTGWFQKLARIALAKDYETKFRRLSSDIAEAQIAIICSLSQTNTKKLQELQYRRSLSTQEIFVIGEQVKESHRGEAEQALAQVAAECDEIEEDNRIQTVEILVARKIIPSVPRKEPFESSSSYINRLEAIIQAHEKTLKDVEIVLDVAHSHHFYGTSISQPNLSPRQEKRNQVESLIRECAIDRSKLISTRPHLFWPWKWTPESQHLIGSGSFGSVYKGIYKNEYVAVKYLKDMPRKVIGQEDLQRIHREIFIMAKCSHPNVITFIGHDKKDWLLVTELADCSLHSIIYEDVLPSAASVTKISWIRDIISGLRFLHSHRILHRDMKLRNVLMVKDTQRANLYIAKISDFGESTISGFTTVLDVGAKTDGSSSTAGTTAYKAPELFTGGAITKATDIYAFGIIMNEMFSCVVPWSKKHVREEEIPHYVKNQQRPVLFPFDKNNQAEINISQLIGDSSRGCWAQEPKQRPTAANIERMLDYINTDWSSIFQAVKIGSRELIENFLREGVDIDFADKNGWTSLHHSSFHGHDGIVKYLLQQGANKEATDKTGNSPLYVAALFGKVSVVKALLDKDANFSYENDNHETCLKLAINGVKNGTEGCEEVERLLRDRLSHQERPT